QFTDDDDEDVLDEVFHVLRGRALAAQAAEQEGAIDLQEEHPGLLVLALLQGCQQTHRRGVHRRSSGACPRPRWLASQPGARVRAAVRGGAGRGPGLGGCVASRSGGAAMAVGSATAAFSSRGSTLRLLALAF